MQSGSIERSGSAILNRAFAQRFQGCGRSATFLERKVPLSRRGVVTACFVGCRWLLQHQLLVARRSSASSEDLGTLILGRRTYPITVSKRGALPNRRVNSCCRIRKGSWWPSVSLPASLAPRLKASGSGGLVPGCDPPCATGKSYEIAPSHAAFPRALDHACGSKHSTL